MATALVVLLKIQLPLDELCISAMVVSRYIICSGEAVAGQDTATISENVCNLKSVQQYIRSYPLRDTNVAVIKS